VDADSELVHTVRSTASHVANVTKGSVLLHGKKAIVFANAGYQSANWRLVKSSASAGIHGQTDSTLTPSIKCRN
jgi:hypothetical protein